MAQRKKSSAERSDSDKQSGTDPCDITTVAMMSEVQPLLNLQNVDLRTYTASWKEGDFDGIITKMRYLATATTSLLSNLQGQKNLVTCKMRLLPTEILQWIFAATLPSTDCFETDQHWSTGFYGQLHRLRLVCAKWARVIDVTPRFWTVTSSYDRLDATAKVLMKSGTAATLEIRVVLDDRAGPYAVEEYGKLVLPYASRSLTTLFDNAAPQLSRVRCELSYLPWSSPVFSGLTSFTLTKVDNPPDTLQVLILLAASPMLEMVDLHKNDIRDVPPDRLALAFNPESPIQLLHIRDFAISAIGLSLCQILDHVAIPLNSNITVHAFDEDIRDITPGVMEYALRRLKAMPKAENHKKERCAVRIEERGDVISQRAARSLIERLLHDGVGAKAQTMTTSLGIAYPQQFDDQVPIDNVVALLDTLDKLLPNVSTVRFDGTPSSWDRFYLVELLGIPPLEGEQVPYQRRFANMEVLEMCESPDPVDEGYSDDVEGFRDAFGVFFLTFQALIIRKMWERSLKRQDGKEIKKVVIGVNGMIFVDFVNQLRRLVDEVVLEGGCYSVDIQDRQMPEWVNSPLPEMYAAMERMVDRVSPPLPE
ncbi:hypothetical protein FRB99_004583 [Tulasnella sp. 403]|nr:hypothetical protein FRB99_004583 [Tulasnella sp. 403]